MKLTEFNDALLGFLDASPTPFHATSNMAKMLENAGFIELDEQSDYHLEVGRRYFVVRNGSSIIAFNHTKDSNYIMIGAHTDSPDLRVRANPQTQHSGINSLAIEPYGGVLLHSWFDRELAIAGRVSYVDNGIKSVLIDTQRAVCTIPSLAIHLDKSANSNHSINPQTDMSAIFATSDGKGFEQLLQDELKRAGVSSKPLSFELSLYDSAKASMIGADLEFISSARLDNLLSCFTALLTLCSSPSDRALLMVCSDHEEVGSASASGAAGPFLEQTLRRMRGSYESYAQLLQSSLLISCDNAHAIHPSYPDRHDPLHAPHINAGVVIKINSNQKYTSNSNSIARFKHQALANNMQTQLFVSRSDLGCGSTIGPITATRLGIQSIDVGIATYAMHSIRELAGSKDTYELYKILTNLT